MDCGVAFLLGESESDRVQILEAETSLSSLLVIYGAVTFGHIVLNGLAKRMDIYIRKYLENAVAGEHKFLGALDIWEPRLDGINRKFWQD